MTYGRRYFSEGMNKHEAREYLLELMHDLSEEGYWSGWDSMITEQCKKIVAGASFDELCASGISKEELERYRADLRKVHKAAGGWWYWLGDINQSVDGRPYKFVEDES